LSEVDPKERIEELNGQLMNELNSWDLLGIEPNNIIAFNPTKNEFWLTSLTQYLANKGIIDEDEFVIFFKERMLSEIRRVRTEIVEPQIARRLHIPGNGPH
jgi:hypothetical protein